MLKLVQCTTKYWSQSPAKSRRNGQLKCKNLGNESLELQNYTKYDVVAVTANLLAPNVRFVRFQRSVSSPSRGQLGVEPSSSELNPKHNYRRTQMIWTLTDAFESNLRSQQNRRNDMHFSSKIGLSEGALGFSSCLFPLLQENRDKFVHFSIIYVIHWNKEQSHFSHNNPNSSSSFWFSKNILSVSILIVSTHKKANCGFYVQEFLPFFISSGIW